MQTPDETLARRIGSCRDSAWLLVSLLRQYGLAARFVSGYLVQLAPDAYVTEASDGPAGPAKDFTDLHAWTEVYLPGAGWVGMDPTSALFAGEGHIPLSATPHPSSAAPIEGATEPVEVTFGFVNEVTRVHEDPRVTAPYSDAQWARIDALGEAVDARLDKGDVRLTMGGEPTFVVPSTTWSATQWNTEADGPEKRELANRLAERLRRTYAAGGVVHRGQGKWYPGEPLPRWNIALQWRTDGVPLWNDPALFADPWAEADDAGRRPRPGGGAGPPGRPRCSGSRRSSCARRTRTRSSPSPTRSASRRASDRTSPTLDADAVAKLDATVTRADRLGAADRDLGGRLDQPAVAVPPRPPGAHRRHERRRPAAAAGRDLVDRPRVRRRAVVPRGRTAAGGQGADRDGLRPRGGADHGAGVRGAGRARARVPARRPSGSRTTPTCSGSSRSRPASSPSRWSSRATARRRTRGSPSSWSPRTPVSSRSTCSRPGAGPSSAT